MYNRRTRHVLYGLIFGTSLLVSACYSPNFQEGLSCSESERCPTGQLCSRQGVCTSPNGGATVDARPSPDADKGPCDPGVETFGFEGSIKEFTLPSCVTNINIEASGAQGGGGIGSPLAGGFGAEMIGDFVIPAGSTLTILVGGRGRDAVDGPAINDILEQGGGSGGGGSFVLNAQGMPLIIAGGGGGATDSTNLRFGGDGQITSQGQAGGEGEPGGNNGDGGFTYANTGFHGGTGGGGLTGNGLNNSNGDTSQYGTPNLPGKSFTNGGAGGIGGSFGRDGGFGGGGSAGFTGGGGGGYSGGGAGGVSSTDDAIGGGGGGSINNGTNQKNLPGENPDDGLVIIRW